jgi:hypothetical protein
MTRRLALNRISHELESHQYPLTVDDAAAEMEDVVLEYADGEEPLLDVLHRSNEDVFVSPDDLESEIYSLLPTEAVGEPGQSEGEG